MAPKEKAEMAECNQQVASYQARLQAEQAAQQQQEAAQAAAAQAAQEQRSQELAAYKQLLAAQLNAQQNVSKAFDSVQQLLRRDDGPEAQLNSSSDEPDSVPASNGTPDSPLNVADSSAAGTTGGSPAGDSLIGAGSGTSDLSASNDNNQGGAAWSDPMPESPANQAVDWFTDKLKDMAYDEMKDQMTEVLKEGIADSGEVGEIAVNLYDNATGAYNTVSSWKNAWTELNSSEADTQIQGTVDATLNLNDEFNANPISKAIVSTFMPVIGNVGKQELNVVNTIGSVMDNAFSSDGLSSSAAQAQIDDSITGLQQAFVPAPLLKLQAIIDSQGFASFSSTVKKIWNWNPFVDTCTGFGC
jgi:hypothetical protein